MRMGKIPAEWLALQMELARRVRVELFVGVPAFVAGVDIAFTADGSTAQAAGVVYDVAAREVIEERTICRPVKYPYVPSFLSFREGPILQELLGELKHAWEVVMFDGQGVAHPRGCGLAAHLGVMLDRPAIGVAKSRLCGEHADPARPAGSFAPLMLEGRQVGIVLRTRDGVKPLYISVGNHMDLDSARRIVLACCKYRIPEPTRQADILTKRK